MAINTTNLEADIAKILGDYESQYTVEIQNEIKNSVIWLTSHYAFSWNTLEQTSVAHSNGVITISSNTAKILQIVDSDSNFNYNLVPEEKFFMQKNSNRIEFYRDAGSSTTIDYMIPFILRENPATGTQTITLGTLTDTPASRTFNILYTKYSTTITDLIGLDRLYPYFVGSVVYNMLIKSENPDTALLATYEKMFMQVLKMELEFGKNRGLQKYNVPVQSPHLTLNNRFNGL